MSSARRTVAVYRDRPLAISETFIAVQAAHLSRYEPLFVGTSRAPRPRIDVAPLLLLEDIAPGRLPKMAHRFARHVPAAWREHLAQHDPLLMHAHFGPDAWLALPLGKALRIPVVATLHGYDVTVDCSFDPRMQLYIRHLRHSVFRDVARVICPSDFLRDRLIDAACPAQKIERLYIGVETDRFSADDHIERDDVVLFVGRLVEKKGCADLIEAMRRIQRPGWRLVVIGDGPQRKSLEQQAREAQLDHDFLGARTSDEVRAWMNRAAVFCVPSRTARNGDAETLGIVFLEAQSMKLPVVSYAHGGIPEAVSDRDTGFLAPEGDVGALAAALAQLASDAALRTRFGQAGRARVERLFDIRECTAALEKLYDSVIDEAAKNV
jgi:glycosyltransferase involved in cell wall biosynthesis